MELKNYEELKKELFEILVDAHGRRAAQSIYLVYDIETQEGSIETLYPGSKRLQKDGAVIVLMKTTQEKSNSDFFDECDSVEDIGRLLGYDDIQAFKKEIADELECEVDEVSYYDAKTYVIEDSDRFEKYMENYNGFLIDVYATEFDEEARIDLDEAMEEVKAEIEE